MIVEITTSKNQHILTGVNFKLSNYWMVRINNRSIGFIMKFSGKTIERDKVIFHIFDKVDYEVYHRHQVGKKSAICLGLDVEENRLVFVDLFTNYTLLPCTLEDIKFFVDPVSPDLKTMLFSNYEIDAVVDYSVNEIKIADKIVSNYTISKSIYFMKKPSSISKDILPILRGNGIKAISEGDVILGFMFRVPIFPTGRGDTLFITIVRNDEEFLDKLRINNIAKSRYKTFKGVDVNKFRESTKEEMCRELGIKNEKEGFVFINELIKNHIKGNYTNKLTYNVYKNSIA